LDAHKEGGGAAFLVDTLTAYMNSRGRSILREEGELYLSMAEGNQLVVADDPVHLHEDVDMDVLLSDQTLRMSAGIYHTILAAIEFTGEPRLV
jgi:hypothetical protein